LAFIKKAVPVFGALRTFIRARTREGRVESGVGGGGGSNPIVRTRGLSRLHYNFWVQIHSTLCIRAQGGKKGAFAAATAWLLNNSGPFLKLYKETTRGT